MTYPEIVQSARDYAKGEGVPWVVYRDLEDDDYAWASKETFDWFLTVVHRPVIRLLLCMPNGSVVQ